MRIGTLALALALAWPGAGSGQTYNIHNYAGGGLPENRAPLTASLGMVRGIAADASGNVYIALEAYHVVVRLDASGALTRVAGNGSHGYDGDGGPASEAQLASPLGVAAGPAGALYIADSVNFRVRRVLDGTIETIAGSGGADTHGDGGPAVLAQLSSPAGVAADTSGALFVAEYDTHRIRRLDGGTITTFAGNGTWGYGGDGGPPANAPLNWPAGIAADPAGNLYIADSNNFRVRKVSGGVITTVAGDGTWGFGGDHGPATAARLNGPRRIAVDADGNLYVSDYWNHRVRRISDGTITTIAGNGQRGYAGDNGSASGARLGWTDGIEVDQYGRVFLSDSLSHRVRVLLPAVTPVSAASFRSPAPLAPGVIAAGFGARLAPAVETAPPGLPLPLELAQTSVRIRDSAGVERTAPLWFVSPGQINFFVSDTTALGEAQVRLQRASQTVASGTIQVASVSPGLFTMTANGRGVPAGQAVLVRPGGPQTRKPLHAADCHANSCRPAPLDLGEEGDLLYLEIYGTGLRGRSALAAVSAALGGVDAPAEYAGPVAGMTGLDQLNARAPRALRGRGEVELVVTVDGVAANPVLLHFQ